MSGSRVRDANGVSADITDTANTAVIAAPGANKRLRIQWITVTNQHADVDPVVSLKNGSTEFDHVQVDALDFAGPHSIRLWYGEQHGPQRRQRNQQRRHRRQCRRLRRKDDRRII